MRITTTQHQPPPVAVVCLQAQHVAGLPAAAEGRQVLLRLPQQATAAAATCRGGVAAFHDQVLLLDCAPVSSSDSVVAVAVTVAGSETSAVGVKLAEQLRRPSPSVLSFVLGVGVGGGAVLSLTLHHRLMTRRRPEPHRRRSGSACMSADLLLSCLRVVSLPPGAAEAAHQQEKEEAGGGLDDGDESSGFITIEKGTISRRRPPSENLLTTDDEEVDGGGTKPTGCLEEDSKVEEEFLAMMDDGDGLDLDALIKDAEAELTARRRWCKSCEY